MLVVECSWTSLEIKMGFVCRVLKHARWAIVRERMCTNNPWDFGIVTIEGYDALENVMVYPPKETFDQSNSHGK
jgi:hypothetical protein